MIVGGDVGWDADVYFRIMDVTYDSNIFVFKFQKHATKQNHTRWTANQSYLHSHQGWKVPRCNCYL